MKKPDLIVVENLLIPVTATISKIAMAQSEVKSTSSRECQNGLFLMTVAFVESMHKEILKYFLRYNPEKISNKKTIEVRKTTLIENEDFHILESLIDEVVDKMPFWQVIKYFYDTMKINKPDNFKTIEAIQKNRNQLIHDNIQVEYKQGSVNHNLFDINYIQSSLSEYEEYLIHLNDEILRKYSEFTRMNALKNLWYYTFKTPLCAKFEDYWHTDLENDSITGYKSPEYEGGLSHSETFMLSIWRSQVSGYKVDFLNMSSLGKNIQACLFMFLKLSNDIFMYR